MTGHWLGFLVFEGCVVGVAIAACTTPWWFWRIGLLIRPSQDAKAVAALLNGDPFGWQRHSHALCHSGANIGIWTPNGHSHLKWWCGGKSDWDRAQEASFGDRSHVHRAIRKWRTVSPGDVAEAATRALRNVPGQRRVPESPKPVRRTRPLKFDGFGGRLH